MINRTHYKAFKFMIHAVCFVWTTLMLAIATVCILIFEYFTGLSLHPVVTLILYAVVGLIAAKLPSEAYIARDFGYACGMLGLKDQIDYDDLKDYFGD